MKYSTPVVGLILAGGLARRMGGGDKCLLPLAGKTILQHTIDRAQPQVDELVLNANGNSLRFARMRLPVITDQYTNNPGPMAGIQAGLAWMSKDNPDGEWLASFASDTPFFPTDIVAKLMAVALSKQAQVAVAVTAAGMQPTFALWHASLLGKMNAVLGSGEIPRLQDWITQQKYATVEFTTGEYDPFFNINTPQDMLTAETQMTRIMGSHLKGL